MRTIKLISIIAILSISISACKNWRAKTLGANVSIELPEGHELLDVTWKDGTTLWYLTTERDSLELPKTYIWHEKTNKGVLEGTYTFIGK